MYYLLRKQSKYPGNPSNHWTMIIRIYHSLHRSYATLMNWYKFIYTYIVNISRGIEESFLYRLWETYKKIPTCNLCLMCIPILQFNKSYYVWWKLNLFAFSNDFVYISIFRVWIFDFSYFPSFMTSVDQHCWISYPNYNDIISLAETLPTVMNNVTYELMQSFDSVSIEKLAELAGNVPCNLLDLPELQALIKNPPTDPPYDLVIVEVC